MKTIKLRIVALFSIGLLTSPFWADAAGAGGKEDALIAKIVAAYGGTRLTGLRGLRVEEVRTSAPAGQGYQPEFTEFNDTSRILQFDLSGGRGSFETWSKSNNGVFQSHSLFDGKNGYNIDYAAGTYSSVPNLFAVTGGIMRTIDALVARDLASQAQTARHLGNTINLGRPHEKIAFTQTDGPVLTLFVDSQTNLITKMARDLTPGTLYYHFKNHESVGGVTFAKRVDLFVNKDVSSIVVSRHLTVNQRFPGAAFALDPRLREDTAERIDVSKMFYQKITENIGHVGQNFAYSTFIDAGRYLVGVGGYAGLKDRLAKFREATGNNKPLRYQIVTHHHTDHLGGMAEARELGATFVIHPASLANLKEAIGDDLPENRLMIVKDRATIANDAVKVYDITTSHAEHLLLAYVTGAKVVFTVDHFGSPYVREVPPARVNGVRLHRAIKDLGLDVHVLLSAHWPGARSWAQFEEAVAAHDPSPCRFNRPICRNEL